MSLQLSRIDASARANGYAAAQAGRAPGDTAPPKPAAPPALVRQVRDQVMAEQGLDREQVARLPAPKRLQTEIWVDTITEARLGKPPKGQGALLDIRV